VRNGVSQPLCGRCGTVSPKYCNCYRRALPKMYAKAYRWIGEMEEIAKFLEPETGGSEMLSGAAHLYEDIAVTIRGSGPRTHRAAG